MREPEAHVDAADGPAPRPRGRWGARIISGGVATAVASVALVAAMASPAAAMPTDCEGVYYGGYGGGTVIICRGGYGYYQAVAVCSRTPSSNLMFIRKSVWQWVGSGQWASRFCDADAPYFRNGWYELTE